MNDEEVALYAQYVAHTRISMRSAITVLNRYVHPKIGEAILGRKDCRVEHALKVFDAFELEQARERLAVAFVENPHTTQDGIQSLLETVGHYHRAIIAAAKRDDFQESPE